MPRSWTQLVAEGKRLVRQEGDAKWALGDLALEIAPMGQDRTHNDSAATLQEFGEAIGVEFPTLREYRRVANEWPHTRARGRASWSVYQVLAGYRDQEKMLTRLVERGKPTVDEARKLLGQRPTRTIISTPRDRVAAVKDLLDDPDVRRQLVQDDRIRRDLNVAEREIDAGRAALVERRQREDAPRLAEARELYDAKARIHRARSEVNTALDLLRGLPQLDADEREALRYDVELLEASVTWLSEFTKARRPETLANEVERFLADQEA